MAKRKTTSRQWMLVHRLNKTTNGLRSRIYRLEENTTNNQYTETRDIGDLPWTWDYFGYRDQVHYLHSTVRGFNQDYKELTHTLNLESHISSTIDNLMNIINRETEILHQTARRDKVRFFGGTADMPLKDTPYVKSLQEGVNIDGTNQTQIQTVIQEMKNASNWYSFEGAFLSALNEKYLHSGRTEADREQFYSQIVDYVWQSWQHFIQLPFKNFVAPDDAQQILDKINQKKITKETISNWIRSKNVSSNSPFKFAKNLGYIYEDAIRESIMNYAIQEGTDIVAKRIGQRNGLVDVALYNNGKSTMPMTIDGLDRFTGGISAKLRINNAFSIEVSGSPKEFFSFAGTDFPPMLDAVRYLYNNWMALSVYNTDSNRAYSNKQGKTRSQKGAVLLEGGTLLGRTFQSFSRIVNLVLIQSAFFANAKDVNAGNVCLFNQKYWDNLIAQLNNNQMTIPNFLFTANDYYETWQVVQYYLHNPLLSTAELFGSNKLLGVENSYNIGALQKLYDAKAKAIRGTHRTQPGVGPHNTLTDEMSLYDAIHINIGGTLPNAFIDIFSKVLNLNRKLSIKFRLIASNKLY